MNKKIGILLSISLLATAATTATIAAIAAKGKFKKQQELKQNIEKSKAELNKAKSILEKLLNSDYAKNVNKLEESKILDNAKIDENSSLQDIKNKTKQVKEALNSLTQKILERKQKEQQNQNDKKTLDKLRLDFANAQEELKALINSKDGKSVDTTKAVEVLKNTKITNSSATFQVLQAVQTIKKATKELQEAIKFKKQQEFNEFNKAKQELTDYIANDLNDLKYKDIKAKAEKSIEKVSDININSSFISDIQQATKLLIDAKKQAISEVEKINKSSELDKYKIAKNKLELLIKTEDAQMIKSANEKAKKILAENTTKDTTLSSEEFKTRRINLENALDELKEAIKNEKNIQKQEFEAKKQELKILLESEWSKDIDKKNETAVWNNAKIDDSDSIKEIKEATKEVQGAIDSLIQKMDEKNKLNPLYAKEKFEKIQKQLQDLINSEDAKFIDTNKASEALKNTKITSTSSIDEINQAIKTLKDAIVELKNAINGAKEDSIKEFDKVKKDLEVLVGSEDARSIEKRTEIGILANTYILERDTIKQIKEKTEAIKKAISSLNKKIEDAKALKNELQKFNDIKAALEQLIKTDDAKEVGTENASKALNNNKVNENSTLEEITKATKALEDAKSKLDQEIKAKKETEFNNLTVEKGKLNELIAKSTDASAKALEEAKNVLAEVEKLNNSSPINLLKNAVIKTKDAIEKLNNNVAQEKDKKAKLAEFNSIKTQLEELIAKDDAIQAGVNEAKKALQDNKADENSTLEEITKATKALQEAKAALELKISKAQEKAKQEFDTKKEQLKTLIGLSDANNVDKSNELNVLTNTSISKTDSIKEIKQKTSTIEEAIKTLNKKVQDKKNEKIQEFEKAKESLEKLVKEEDAKEVGIDSANEALKTKVDEKLTIEEIKNAILKISNEETKLKSSIESAKHQAKETFDSKKQELKSLLDSTTSEVDKKAEEEKYNKTTIDNDSTIKQIKQKTSDIENAITTLKEKIAKVKGDKAVELQKFNLVKQQLEELIAKEVAKEVGTSKAEEALKVNVVDKNSTLDAISKATKALEDAKSELAQNIIDTKNNATKTFNDKKDELNKLLDTSDAKSVDNKKESDVLKDNSIDSNTPIKEIKAKTEKITEAINSLTTSIKNKKDEEFNKYNDIKTSLENLIKEEDAVQVGIADVQKTLSENNVDKTATIEKIQHSTEALTHAKEELKKLIDTTKKQLTKEFETKKSELEKLISLPDANNVDKKDELSIFGNTNITNSDSIKQIKEKITKIQNALESLTNKISKQKEQELEKYNTTKTALEQLIKDEDAKEVGTTDANAAITKNKADKNSTLEEITNATKALEDAKSKLDQEIKTKKEAEFNNLTKAKTELSDLITSSSNQAPADAISDAQKTLDEINKLNLTNVSTIKSMKDATQKIEAANKALKQAIEKLKAEKLQKFNEAKTALENLVKEEDAIQTGVEAAKKALDDNNKINKNSTLEEITNATKALEDAKSKLDQEIKTKKEAEFNNLTNAKTELSNLITKQAPAEAISKAKKVLEEINGLNLSNDSSIKSLKDATQKIKDAETQLTAEIEKTEKLKEFDEARKSLRELIKDDDAKEVETSKAKEALKTNKADENSSIEEIIKATKALEDAKFELNQEIRVQKDRLMDKLNAKNKKLDALLKTENLDDLMSIEKLIGLSAGEIKNKLEDAKKLLQEAKGLSENSKITNIKQKIQKIDEYVRQFEPWISNMLKIKGGLVSVINSNIEQLKKFKAKKFNNNFISKLNEKLNSNIFNNLSKNMKLADLKKIEEDSVNLLRLVKLQEKYENDDKLSPSLQKKTCKRIWKNIR
uniref:Variable membrane protein n=1 Tax=Metamycoplasma hominis TaxID=2098 RepID=Q700S8_METHO|nr:variable membrane protein precursor [Metamycoplasma hominis]